MRVKVLWEQGYSDLEISRDPMVNMVRQVVYKWTRRFEEDKDKADEEIVLSQTRSGRPLKATTALGKKITKHVKGKRRKSVRKVATWLQSTGYDLGRETVRKVLKKAGLYPYKRKKQPRLTQAQREKRVKFARKFKKHNWLKTLMTDEKDFNLFAATNPQNDRVWTDNPEDVPNVELVKHASGVKVWAGVSATGKTKIHFYEGTIGAQEYKQILTKAKEEMEGAFEDDDWTFQHDGASAHKAKVINEWLEKNVPNHITSGPGGDWPGNSPDLNYIENVWAYMADKLELNPPKTTDALKQKIRKIWKEMPQDMLVTMANSMKKRLSDVVEAKGGSIGK